MWERVFEFLETPSRARTATCLGLTLVPAAFLLAVMVFLTVDAPFLDEWIWVPYIAKSYEGTLTFSDLWAQHNEHRPFFPKIITIVLVHLTHWRTASLQAVAFLLATGIMLLVWMRLRALSLRRFQGYALGALPFMALTAYSMDQWENFFMGIQFQEHLNVFSAVAGFMLLTVPRRTWFYFWAAAFMGLPATCSLANGLGFWPIALLLLYFSNRNPVRRARECELWCVISLAVGIAYFYGYQSPPAHPSPLLALQHPLGVVLFVLIAFGGPLVAYTPMLGIWGLLVAGLMGLLGLMLHVILVILLCRKHGFHLRELAPFMAMVLFAAFSAAATGVGRLTFGLDQGMSPRYLTCLNLLWLADIALVTLYIGCVWSNWQTTTRLACVAVACIFAGLLTLNSLYGAYRWSERYAYRMPARTELRSGNNPELLQRLFPVPNLSDSKLVIEYREILRKYKLSVFRE